MSSFSTLPLVLNNQDFVSTKQLNNSLNSSGYILSDDDFENYITYKLAEQTAPSDLLNNEYPNDPANSLDIIDSSFLNQTVIINNNDTLLVNENFSMKMNYVHEPISSYDSYTYSIGGGEYINTNVALLNTTHSLYDSNIKIDVSFNNDTQYTDNDGAWSVDFDRSSNNMNNFACINSYLEDPCGNSPFYILENSVNIYSLGNNPESVANPGGTYYGTHKYFTRDSSGIMIPHDINSSYTLDANFCRSELNDLSNNNNAYQYHQSEFNTFKIIQDQPHVDNTLQDENYNNVSGLVVPIQYNGSNINSSTFDVSNIFYTNNSNWNLIGDQFQISLNIGDSEQGGYTNDPLANPVFEIDDSQLYRDVNNPYLTINPQNTPHLVDITNGYITTQSVNNSGNEDFINIGNESENLTQNYYDVSGEVCIFTKDVNNRVYYENGMNSIYDTSFGTPSSLTDSVEVYYNSSEWSYGTDINSSLSNYIKGLDNVYYSVEVISPSTATTILADDNRNLAKNNNALLTVSTTNSDINLYDLSFVLQSNLSTDPNYLQIISIQNESILADNAPIKDQSGNDISGGSVSSVLVQNINLDELNYQNYRVIMTTKTVSDISNLLQLNNGWSVASSTETPYMIGDSTKTGVIRDDYLFMTNTSNLSGQSSGMDISMSHTFQLASNVITSTQAVKHQIEIKFTDLASNTTYDNYETMFYLDDQDISLNPVGSPVTVEDPSCITITPSSLNTGSTTYSASNYNFKKFTTNRKYIASYDSKFQFYTNLRFVTPTITERSTYYQIYDLCGNQLPSYMLKYFQCVDNNHLLSNVYVDLVDESDNVKTYNTGYFDFTQEVCSILNVDLHGTFDGVNYVDVSGSFSSYLDPFFNLKTTIHGFDGQDAVGTINVKLNNGVIINQTSYYIQTIEKPGMNVSFSATKYVYSVGYSDPILENFTFYNNFYDIDGSTHCNVNLEISGNTNIMSISDGTGLLATILHPSYYINNYNIIVCSAPLMFVNGNEIDYFYTLAVDNKVQVDNGVYYYNINNPSIGMSDTFYLSSDSFSLKFSNGNGFPNNSQYVTRTLFTSNIVGTPLYCENNTYDNHTKSVEFSFVRGYNSTYNQELPFDNITNSYYDVIALLRTPSTLTFRLYDIAGGNMDISGSTAEQYFGNIYNGMELNVDNVVGLGSNNQTYNLGLLMYINLSTLSDDQVYYKNTLQYSSYNISVRVASYFTNIDGNPYAPSIINEVSSGYVTDIEQSGPSVGLQKDLLYPYILGVKASCIKSYGNYTLRIVRNVPDLKVYSLDTPSYIGNPLTADVNPGVWNYEFSTSYNDFVLTGFQLSNLNVRRLAADADNNGHVVFYNSYYSYYVVAPPSFSVYGYHTNINVMNVPVVGYTPSFFTSFDVNNDSNSYYYNSLTFSQDNIFNYVNYLTVHDKYSFLIEGNYISISIYNGGIGLFGTNNGPDYVDSHSAAYETLYTNVKINELSDVSNYVEVSRDASLNYNIDYKQILLSSYSHYSNFNIHFSVGNAFLGPNADPNNTGRPTYYLRTPTDIGTEVSFYQANIIYNDTSGNGLADIDPEAQTGYFMIIDKYDTDSNINYNVIIDGTIREVYFPVQTHKTKEIYLGEIVDASGNIINQQDYLNQITLADVSNASWMIDNSFELQYIGITISALSNAGKDNIGNLLKYNQQEGLKSKALYVRRQDAIRMTNVLGNNLFRVTNSGNVHSQRIVTSNVSLFYPPNTIPNINTNIVGSSDIMSIFAQNTIINN